ncbi:DUF3850 domain-containing protein [Paenibacillus naphthalenovorans]|uniref:DUF3850 domain-containing protein n=1 Tax=Paenibacillus naphthalenovorans TaxID=162209 RepID=UPI00088BCF63|nr:DUF3850 domain-containing protein [Paenibacillus naphthalenovorans]SDI49742.1 protein of unknown function [Paenibacillus naphthalenovorans]
MKYDTHELKTWPEYFELVVQRKKNFEVRRNDRDFKVGDLLWLREYSHESGYTGRETGRFIAYILDNPDFVKEGYVILSF